MVYAVSSKGLPDSELRPLIKQATHARNHLHPDPNRQKGKLYTCTGPIMTILQGW